MSGSLTWLTLVEVAPRHIEILAEDAELNVAIAEDVANLAQHLFYSDVGPGVAGAIVPGEQELELAIRESSACPRPSSSRAW